MSVVIGGELFGGARRRRAVRRPRRLVPLIDLKAIPSYNECHALALQQKTRKRKRRAISECVWAAPGYKEAWKRNRNPGKYLEAAMIAPMLASQAAQAAPVLMIPPPPPVAFGPSLAPVSLADQLQAEIARREDLETGNIGLGYRRRRRAPAVRRRAPVRRRRVTKIMII